MLSDLLKWGTKRAESSGRDAPANRDEPIVASKALPKMVASLSQRDSPILLDFGPVIGANVAFCGERLGCKLFIEDLLADIDRHLRGKSTDDLAASFEKRFAHADAGIDGILCWDLFDFLDKPAATALARQIVRLLKPGGAVMGFFCTTSVERSAFTKYEIVDENHLRHRHHPGVGGKRQSLQNRDILKMFEGLSVADSFLLKNNTREMLLRKKA
ncbi:MAG: class I SAM-dependent methyltransferase [Vicinamibacterales bacterium]